MSVLVEERDAATPRSAVVTGAARGIGRAIALRLAHDGLGVTVNDMAAARDELGSVAAEIEALGRRGLVAVADVSREEEVDALVAAHVDAHGGLDVMVANAGRRRHCPAGGDDRGAVAARRWRSTCTGSSTATARRRGR